MVYKKCASSYMVSSCLTNALRTIMTRPSFQVRFASFQLSVCDLSGFQITQRRPCRCCRSRLRPRWGDRQEIPCRISSVCNIHLSPPVVVIVFAFVSYILDVSVALFWGVCRRIKNFSTNCFHWKLFVFLKDLGGVFLVWGRAVI